MDGRFSERFTVRKGLRQGGPLSNTLFNLVLETNCLIFHKIQCIAYADDVTILTGSKSLLEKAFEVFEEKVKNM